MKKVVIKDEFRFFLSILGIEEKFMQDMHIKNINDEIEVRIIQDEGEDKYQAIGTEAPDGKEFTLPTDGFELVE